MQQYVRNNTAELWEKEKEEEEQSRRQVFIICVYSQGRDIPNVIQQRENGMFQQQSVKLW